MRLKKIGVAFAPLGDSAVVATVGLGMDQTTLRRVRALANALEGAAIPGIVDIVPAYATVAVFYDPARVAGPGETPYDRVCRALAHCVSAAGIGARRLPAKTRDERLVEIPVCYGGDFGPDLAVVSTHTRLSPGEVIARHSGADYRVHAIGFSPGFPYLAGLPPELQTPRRGTPRESVPAGSVGIGGAQTGVYPISSPGGWQLIGRTPLTLFDPRRDPPALLRMGDQVRFKPVTREEADAWK